MRRVDRKSERGVSLLFSTAYFASRAGVEEVRDRMLKTNPNTINCTTQVTDCGLMPTALPSAAGGVLYILQNGVTGADITNIVSSNQVADDELCHDFPYNGAGYGGMTPVGANVRCTTLPAGPLWYTTTASTAPFAGSNNPLDYKWVRVTLKAANSTAYPVDPTQPAATNQVCWNGTSEVLLPGGTATCLVQWDRTEKRYEDCRGAPLDRSTLAHFPVLTRPIGDKTSVFVDLRTITPPEAAPSR